LATRTATALAPTQVSSQVLPELNADRPTPLANGMNGVGAQIEQRLLPLGGIGQHQGRAGWGSMRTCVSTKGGNQVRDGAFFSFPRTGTTVVTVGRTASGDTALGGAVSFFGFLTILLLC